MKYKLNSNNQRFIMKSNSSNFALQDTKDIVELTFNEEDQIFTAKIKSPSKHTLHLLNAGLLGIALCKLNTGVSQRKHMQTVTNRKEWTFVKKHCHPRWSRCGDMVYPVTSLERTDMDISRYVTILRPNQTHTLGERHFYSWFTYIKATLVSCVPSDYVSSSEFDGRHSRAYKTYSNRIGVQYVEADNKVTIRDTETNGQSEKRRSGFTATLIGPRTFRIEFENLSRYWLDSTVEILMSTRDISNPHSHGSYKKTYGSSDDFRSYAVEVFTPIHSNTYSILGQVVITSNSDYFDVTIPDLSNISIYSTYIHSRVYHAYSKAEDNNFEKGAFYYNSPIYIQIRKNGHDSKMQCLNYETETISYNTNLGINIYISQ